MNNETRKPQEPDSVELFWQQTNEAYAALKADPTAWAEELVERLLWEQTLADGNEDY